MPNFSPNIFAPIKKLQIFYNTIIKFFIFIENTANLMYNKLKTYVGGKICKKALNTLVFY